MGVVVTLVVGTSMGGCGGGASAIVESPAEGRARDVSLVPRETTLNARWQNKVPFKSAPRKHAVAGLRQAVAIETP